MGKAAGANRWRLRSKSKGARISKTFATKKEALAHQKRLSQQLHQSGTQQSELVLSDDTQKHLRAALDAGIDAQDLREAAELWLASTRGSEGKDLTLAEAVAQAQDSEHFKSLKKSTRDGYRSKWHRFVTIMGTGKKLCQIGSQDIRNYLHDISGSISKNEAFSTHSNLRTLYRTYFRKHLHFMERTPFDGDMIPAPSGRETTSKEPYKEWEFKKIFLEALREAKEIQKSPKRSSKELSYVPSLLIQALTGMRPGEAGQLTYGMFGEEGFIHHIDRSSEEEEGDENLIILPRKVTKEKKVRQIVIFDELKESLFFWPHFLWHFDICPEGFRVKPEHKNKRVFEYSYADFSRRLKKWCRAAGVDYRQNSLRHTFISHAIRGKFDGHMGELQFTIGHAKDTETTIRHYMTLIRKREAKAYFIDYSTLYAHKPSLQAFISHVSHIRRLGNEELLIPKGAKQDTTLPNVVEVDFKAENKLRKYTEKRARIEEAFDE